MRDKILLGISVVLFLSSFLIFNFFGLNLNDVVQLPQLLVEKIAERSTDLGDIGTKFLVSFVSALILGFGFLFLGLYSLKTLDKEKIVKRNSMIAASSVILASLAFYGIATSYIFFSVGFVIACYFSSLYYKTVMEELKRWNSFRAGSRVVKHSLTIIALVFAIGVFIQASQNSDYYSAVFSSDNASQDNVKSIEGFENLTDEEQQRLLNNTQDQERNERLRSILPLYQAIAVFLAMLGMKPLIGPICGSLSALLIKILN